MTSRAPEIGSITTRELVKRQRREEKASEALATHSYAIWYDATGLNDEEWATIVPTLARAFYSGIMVNPGEGETRLATVPASLQKIVAVNGEQDLAFALKLGKGTVVVSDDQALLAKAISKQLPTCFKAFVDSNDTLHAAINSGKRHAYLSIRFRDPTNIPLELVIASLQSTGTVLINEIADSESVEAAVVALGVMEVGADGIMFSPKSLPVIRRLGAALIARQTTSLVLVDATIVLTRPVGMGYRSCIDLATLFQPTEGMLIGSTSHGGILCCPEVFHLPYMELRPFRINAGAVHSYVYGPNNQTNYLTELSAGSEALIVGLDGKTRLATVGRMKTELRPLRLIEVVTDDGTRINTIMQDDWHVRIFSAEGKPRNITELKSGDRVRAMQAVAGRHVGIAVEENIFEN